MRSFMKFLALPTAVLILLIPLASYANNGRCPLDPDVDCAMEKPPYYVIVNRSVEYLPEGAGAGCWPWALRHPEVTDCVAQAGSIDFEAEVCLPMLHKRVAVDGIDPIIYEMCCNCNTTGGRWMYRIREWRADGTCPIIVGPDGAAWGLGLPPSTRGGGPPPPILPRCVGVANFRWEGPSLLRYGQNAANTVTLTMIPVAGTTTCRVPSKPVDCKEVSDPNNTNWIVQCDNVGFPDYLCASIGRQGDGSVHCQEVTQIEESQWPWKVVPAAGQTELTLGLVIWYTKKVGESTEKGIDVNLVLHEQDVAIAPNLESFFKANDWWILGSGGLVVVLLSLAGILVQVRKNKQERDRYREETRIRQEAQAREEAWRHDIEKAMERFREERTKQGRRKWWQFWRR